MKKIKSVTTTYIDSKTGKESQEIVVRDVSQYCLALDEPDSGIKFGDNIIYADGSWREAGGCGNVIHRPSPLGGQYPQERPKVILRYWETIHEKARTDFDELKSTLERRGATFQINKDGRSVDALERLKELQGEVQTAATMYKEAEIALEEATPQSVQDAGQRALKEVERKAAFSNEVCKIVAGETIDKPQRSSRR